MWSRAGISVGAGVRARVLSMDSNGYVQLSVRPSDGGLITGLQAPGRLPADVLQGIDSETAPVSLKPTQLKINQQARLTAPSSKRPPQHPPNAAGITHRTHQFKSDDEGKRF